MIEIGFGGAALAGLLSFLSPCVLPMAPVYLCSIARISMQALRDEGRAPPRGLVPAAAALALGVTPIFVLLGLGATAVGAAFARWQTELLGSPPGFLRPSAGIASGRCAGRFCGGRRESRGRRRRRGWPGPMPWASPSASAGRPASAPRSPRS
jgi:hypothetical protein